MDSALVAVGYSFSTQADRAEILTGSDLFRADPTGYSIQIGQVVHDPVRDTLILKGKADKYIMPQFLLHAHTSHSSTFCVYCHYAAGIDPFQEKYIFP